MSTTEADPAVHPKFVDPGHDIVIQAGDALNADGSTRPATLFQMRKSAVAGVSAVFAEMMSLPVSQEGGNIEPVHLSEPAAVLAKVLTYTQQDVDSFPDLSGENFDSSLLPMWSACMKYAMAVPQAMVEVEIL